MTNAPVAIATLSEKDKARFWSKVNKDGPIPDQSIPSYAGLGPCWLWTSATGRRGYGVFSLRCKQRRAQRVAFTIANGSFEPSLWVLHKCDNELCVNPSHLFLGNCQDNEADKCAKDRQAKGMHQGMNTHPETRTKGEAHWSRLHPENRPFGIRNGAATKPHMIRRGEQHGMAVLTPAEVLEIRALYADGNVGQCVLARRFGVGQGAISRIVLRKSWAHL